MKTESVKMYTSPTMEVCEMVLEAPIASSVGSTTDDGAGIKDSLFDDWGTL